jgi:hypothetical protein
MVIVLRAGKPVPSLPGKSRRSYNKTEKNYGGLPWEAIINTFFLQLKFGE